MIKRKLKLKKPVIKILKFILALIFIFLSFVIFNNYQISKLEKIGYSKLASKNIIKYKKKDIAYKNSNNKTLNAAFESEFFDKNNLNYYIKIKYQDQKNIIRNINNLIKKGYSTDEISIILSHGNDADVTAFSKKDKVRYLDEFLSLPYAKLNLYDRYLKYSDDTGEDGEVTVLHVNLNMDLEPYENAYEIDEFSIDMLVNKRRKINKNVKPLYLMDIPNEYTTSNGMQASRLAFDAYIEMLNDAKKEGLDFKIHSAYRSFDEQTEIEQSLLKTYGENYVKRYVAKPGFSEHQTGLAFDFKSVHSNVFERSPEYVWLQKNCYKYGFIYRFQKEKQFLTGYKYEPWHYRYVGKSMAKEIYDKNLSLEEYFVMYLDK